MKKLITLFLILIATTAFADTTAFTFSITSSASTATPNIRIAKMKPPMTNGNLPIQSFVWDETENYFLTKSTAVSYNGMNTKALLIQADQDTKFYRGTDLTNYILIYSGVPTTVLLR